MKMKLTEEHLRKWIERMNNFHLAKNPTAKAFETKVRQLGEFTIEDRRNDLGQLVTILAESRCCDAPEETLEFYTYMVQEVTAQIFVHINMLELEKVIVLNRDQDVDMVSLLNNSASHAYAGIVSIDKDKLSEPASFTDFARLFIHLFKAEYAKAARN
jgi:hypothetical protein